MKTQTEIVIETLQFYLADPSARRSKSDSSTSCFYHMVTSDGDRNCAVGRCMTTKAIDLFGNFGGTVSELKKQLDLGDTLDTLFREEYRGQSERFWLALQYLHDNNLNWSLDDFGAKHRGDFIRSCFPDAVQPALDLGLIK